MDFQRFEATESLCSRIGVIYRKNVQHALLDNFCTIIGLFLSGFLGGDFLTFFFSKKGQKFITNILSVMSSLSRPVSLNDISCGLWKKRE